MNSKASIRYLSLAAKAGALVTGGEEVEKAMRRGKRGMLVVASDAASNAVRRAERLADRTGVHLYKTHYTKSELASAVGRGSSVAIALVTDGGLASAFAGSAGNGTEREDEI